MSNADAGNHLIDELLDGVGLGLPLPPEAEVTDGDLAAVAGTFREPLGTTLGVAAREGGLDLALLDDPSEPVRLRPASPTRFVVREGEDRGDWAEFFEGGRLMRYDTLFERVPA